MAIDVGSIVAMHAAATALPDTAFGPPIQQQPPIFGIVDAFADPATTVLWQNGSKTLVDVASLDEITSPDPGQVTALAGKFVEPLSSSLPSSPEYQGTVVALYIRVPGNGVDPASDTRALVRTNVVIWYEYVSSQLQAVSGR